MNQNSKYLKMAISLGVVGSRTFVGDNCYDKLKETLTIVQQQCTIKQIVSGGAVGADSYARKFALETGIPILELKPDWSRFGKAAGMLRNTDIVRESDVLIAFWDGESRGTLDSINKAEQMGKDCYIIRF